MTSSFVIAAITVVASTQASWSSLTADTNADLIFKPLDSKGGELAEKMLILIPGADVATEYYTNTVQAIQEQSNLRLWVIVPSVPGETCISTCSTASLCQVLDANVSNVFDMAVAQGYSGTDQAPDAFLAGHSLGGTCAANLSQHKHNKKHDYAALIELGSYVTGHNVGGWPTPVMTIGAELDGGLGRPSNLNQDIVSSDKATLDAGESLDSMWQATNKPVVIIPGIDHSDFCDQYHVPGDVYPSAVSGEKAETMIGEMVSAFLHIQTEQSDDLTYSAYEAISHQSSWARDDLLSAYRQALNLEASADGQTAPWCEMSEKELAGLKNADDQERMNVISVNEDNTKSFEDTRVTWEKIDNNQAQFNVSGYAWHYEKTNIVDSCYTSALELGCKLASSDRVADELNVKSANYDDTKTCMDLNKYAYSQTIEMLSQTEAGKTAVERHNNQGRPICFLEDTHVPGNVGPVWVDTHMKIQDTTECLNVQSSKLGPQGLHSPIFPGVHYCKLISPARVIDYIMIDSLKALGGCLNVDPVTEFLQ